MARPSRARIAGPSLYQQITARILSDLEAGCVPWVQPWASGSAPLVLPRNIATGRAYSGINILMLWDELATHGFTSHRWLSFRQALALGGHVRKGEHGAMIVYADRFTPDAERERAAREARDPHAIPFLKRFTVFNVDQCAGLPDAIVQPGPPPDLASALPAALALIEATGADLRVGGDKAYYAPDPDIVQVPPPSAFFEPVNWHRTAFHELAHWTGHRSRLARDQTARFGTPDYAREELVAEMGGAFVCAALGIVPTVRHADYLGAWLSVLREDERAIIRAASAASKAADYLLAFGGDGIVPSAASGPLPEVREGLVEAAD